jgi:flagellar assembly protein FliH
MSKIIPKDQLTAYQRWEMAAIDEVETTPQQPQAQGQSVAAVMLPTAEDLQRLQDQAHHEGYQAGYQEGRKRAQQDVDAVKRTLASMGESLSMLDQQVAQDILDLSLEIAKQMIRQALKVKPGLLLPMVREAMNSLPSIGAHPAVVLHPEDAVLVRSFLDADMRQHGWRILEDSRMNRGGCRIETSSSEIDASLQTRWKRVVAALGESDEWLE